MSKLLGNTAEVGENDDSSFYNFTQFFLTRY